MKAMIQLLETRKMMSTTVSADLNYDGEVGFRDLLVIASNYNQSGSYTKGDLTGDGRIDIGDVIALSMQWGNSNSRITHGLDVTAFNVGSRGPLSVYRGDLTLRSGTHNLSDVEVQGRLYITGNAIVQLNNVSVRGSVKVDGSARFDWLGGYLTAGFGQGGNISLSSDSVNHPARISHVHMSGALIDAVRMGASNVVIERCWIHNYNRSRTTHTDGIQSLGTVNGRIQYNLIECNNATSCLMMGQESRLNSNVVIKNNAFRGDSDGGYAVYARNLTLIYNVFLNPSSGSYRAVSAGPGLVAYENYWEDGRPI